MKVALLIGHQKDKQGACNEAFKICEYTFNKEFTALVEDYIEENSKEITVNRVYRKTSYSQLPTDLNKEGYDLIVSFHCNAFNKKASGTSVLYYYKSKKARSCAVELQKSIVDILELRNRGVKPLIATDRGGYLLSHTKAVTVLIEPFFIDNNEDYITAEAMMKELTASLGDAIIKCKKIVTEE